MAKIVNRPVTTKPAAIQILRRRGRLIAARSAIARSAAVWYLSLGFFASTFRQMRSAMKGIVASVVLGGVGCSDTIAFRRSAG